MQTDVIDLFAGAGGLDLGAREHGIDPLGIELDAVACATREAAGLRTMHADVAELDPRTLAPITGMLGSPPCPTFSVGGSGNGRLLVDVVDECARAIARGQDDRATARDDAYDLLRQHEAEDRARRDADMSVLVVEPLRFACALTPRWIVLEQVPPVLAIWEIVGVLLRRLGYSAWTGLLNAADYGVPQTRTRAILLARADDVAAPPRPTHQRKPRHRLGAGPLFVDSRPYWVTMAHALGWDFDDYAGFPRLADTPSNRATEVVEIGGTRYRGRDLRSGGEPAHALTEKVRSWTRWVHHRPATTVQGDPRIGRPGHKDRDQGESQFEDGSVRVTLEEAATLQGFPPDWPWQGNQTQRFRQVGNAVPPALAAALVGSVVVSR